MSTGCGSGMQCESKRLGEMELDAARALADFAQMAKIEREEGVITTKHPRKHTKRELEARSSGGLNISRSEHACLVDEDPRDSRDSGAVGGQRIKVEQISELSNSNTSCSSSHVSCFGRRMKQNMTEAEREARRIRRVLANRESARQTIRRRQALREELIRRVADLSVENKNIKMEKELVMKEYLSLKEKNKQLKEQAAKAVKAMVEGRGEITCRHVERPSDPSTELSLKAPGGESSMAWPLWPSISPDSATCYKTSNVEYMNFIPDRNDFKHCPHGGDVLARDAYVGRKRDVLLTGTATPKEVKNTAIDLEEMPVGFREWDEVSPDTSGTGQAHLPRIVNPCPEDEDEERASVKVDLISDEQGHVAAQKSQVAIFPFLHKLVDPTAAAAARRRRKELIKLKYLQGMQIGLHS